MPSLSDEIKRLFRTSDLLMRLILVNASVYIGLKLVYLSLWLFQSGSLFPDLIRLLSVPADVTQLLFRPWTPFTYMFLHENFFHILFNMLWLFWFGKIFLEYLGPKKLLSTYLLGGLSGALLYIIAFNVFPVFSKVLDHSYALGASAGVLAVVIGIATLLPDYTVLLILIGPVKLKYIAAVSVLIDLMSIAEGNAGGHIAHLGGALFGWIYVSRLKDGKDLAAKFNSFIDRLVTLFSRKKIRVVHKRTMASDEAFIEQKKSKQQAIDEILDKISKSGYESLTKEEKEILFRMSKEK